MNPYAMDTILKMLAKKKAAADQGGPDLMDQAVAGQVKSKYPAVRAQPPMAPAQAQPPQPAQAPAAVAPTPSAMVPGAPVYGPSSLASVKPPLVPGAPVAGPQPLGPAAPGTTGGSAQRAAELDAQIGTYRRMLVGGPTISPQDRMLAQEKLRALLPERKALEGAQAPGPKFLDSAGAANSTQRLLEQTIAQLKSMQGSIATPDPTLATRLASTQAELDKVKSGQYADEYNSPERVAARDAAMQKHMAYAKAQQAEADRLGAIRQRATDEANQAKAIHDAEVQAQLAKLQHGTTDMSLEDRMKEAQIKEAESGIGLKAKLTDAQLQKLALESKSADLQNRVGEQQFKDSQKFGLERDQLVRSQLGSQAAVAQTDEAKAKADKAIADQMTGMSGALGKTMVQDKMKQLFYEKGLESKSLSDFSGSAGKDWGDLIAPLLGGPITAPDRVSGLQTVDPNRAQRWVTSYVDRLERAVAANPEEAKKAARELLNIMPTGGVKRIVGGMRGIGSLVPVGMIGHAVGGLNPDAQKFADILADAHDRLQAIANGG